MAPFIYPSDYEHWTSTGELYSSSSVRGTFNRLLFLVRLREHDHSLLQQVSGGIQMESADSALLNAFGIYFHETIHWWQHAGTTLGLMLSLQYPAQLHVNRQHLRELLAQIGPQKPLVGLHRESTPIAPDAQRTLNIILNNWHDSEFNSRLLVDPGSCRQLERSKYFDSVGHSLEIGLIHALWLLGATLKGEDTFLPDIRQWQPALESLKRNKVEGFHRASPGTLTSVGARHLFEAQARFSQLQYLYLASGGNLDWEEFRSAGMLGEVYVEALHVFLKITGLPPPPTVVDSTMLLFLLVCDIAVNPGDGYPFDIRDPAALIELTHPGHRFVVLCDYIARNPKLAGAVSSVSRGKYLELSEEICRGVGMHSPHAIFQRIAGWTDTVRQIRELQREDAEHQFINANLPARVWFARHIRFAKTRLQRPEFFCWPAMHFVGNPITTGDLHESLVLWDAHSPMFVANFGGQIQPSLANNIDPAKAAQTATDFFAWQVLYDLTQQWIIGKGPFKLDYTWINEAYTAEVIKPFATSRFEDAFDGVGLDDFRVLSTKQKSAGSKGAKAKKKKRASLNKRR